MNVFIKDLRECLAFPILLVSIGLTYIATLFYQISTLISGDGDYIDLNKWKKD